MYIENTTKFYKQLAVTRNRNLRPIIAKDDKTTHQVIEMWDYLVLKEYNGKQMKVFQFQGAAKLTPVVNKQIKNKILSLIKSTKELNDWFNKKSHEFPKGFIWTGQEVVEEPETIYNHYSMNDFLSTLSDKGKKDIIHEFSSVETKNQFVNFKVEEYLDELNIKKPINPNVVTKARISKLFSVLPEQYGEFINAQYESDYISLPIDCEVDWRKAKALPDNIAIGVLYHKKKPIRFSDAIIIKKDGSVKLMSMYTLGFTIEPMDENLMLFGYKVEEDVKRIIYVTHQIDQKTNKVTSSWKLYK